MALFPAYQEDEKDEEYKAQSLSWLRNESFPSDTITVPVSKLSTDDGVSNDADISHKLTDEYEEKEINTGNKSNIHELECEEDIFSAKSPKKFKKVKHKKTKVKKAKRKHRKKDYSSDSDENAICESVKLEHLNLPIFDGQNKQVFLNCSAHLATSLQMLYLDRCPDKNNSIFACTHYSQVANYPKIKSMPLGVNGSFAKRKKKGKRYFNSKLQIDEEISTPVKRIDNKVEAEYIPINFTYEEEKACQKTELTTSIDSLGIMDTATQSYIMDKTPSSNEKVNISDSNPERKYWQNQIELFNKRLNKEPHNIELWLEFVDLQDSAICHIFELEKRKEKKTGRSFNLLNERKISLLDAAINKNPKSLQLHLKRLNCGEKVWTKDKLKSHWDKLISTFPNDMDVWYNYLIFHQTYFPLFHLSKVVHIYAKCAETLLQMRNGTFVSNKPPDNIGYLLIDLTYQLAYAWCQGGYVERSVALFQALIEFNLFVPIHLKSAQVNDDIKLDIFEAFWDSLAPRFGDKEAIGWEEFMKKKEPVIFPEEILEGQRDEEDDILAGGGKRQHLWSCLESSRELSHWLPWQRDPDNCEDPEKMISFSVIRKHMFSISSNREIFYLVLQFIKFLGVSIPSSILSEFPSSPSWFLSLNLESFKTLKLTRDTLKQSQFNFPVIGPSLCEIHCSSYFEFVIEVINQLFRVIPLEFRQKLVVILIKLFTERGRLLKENDASDVDVTIKQFKEKIKSFLQMNEFRSDLEVYFEYATFEAITGRKKDAVKAHTAAIALGLQRTSTADIEEFILQHLIALTMLEFESDNIGSKNINKVANVICSVVLERQFKFNDDASNLSQVFRVKKKLTQIIDSTLSISLGADFYSLKRTGHLVFLLALLQLVTVGLKPACSVFENAIESIKVTFNEQKASSNKCITKFPYFLLEIVYEYYFWIIQLIPRISTLISCVPLAPSLIRQIIESALKISPANIIFLEQCIIYQSWRDVFRSFDLLSSSESDILVILFRLLPHIEKVVNLMKTTDGTIGCGFHLEKILESTISGFSQNCPLLWRLYLRLIKIVKPKQIKDVAFRAISSCPNAKCLYLDCIKLAPDVIDEVLKLMEEKGLRIRVPLEELDLLLEKEEELIEEDVEPYSPKCEDNLGKTAN